MSDLPAPEPVEEQLADRLAHRPGAGPFSQAASSLLHRLAVHDRAVYGAVARLRTPLADAPLRRVSGFADLSKPWLLASALLVLLGGRRGRGAAVAGLTSVGAASLVVNQPLKAVARRRRPDRVGLGVPEHRWVSMPTSRSFPSGHSASAAAFAVAVGGALPALRPALWASASVVAFSRVHTGVHYPSDVLVGVGIGAVLGRWVPPLVVAPLGRLVRAVAT